MAQQTYRANLSSAVFPMTIAKSGRSVIAPQNDQNFDKRVDSPGDNSKGSVGIPQAVYMENVFPTPDGFQSVLFAPTGLPISIPNLETLNCVIPIKLATIISNTEITTDVNVVDTGDTIENWTKSNFLNFQLANPYDTSTFPSLGDSTLGSFEADVQNTIYTEVAESSTEGSPSVNSYRLSHIMGETEVLSGSDPTAYSARLTRSLEVTDSTTISFDYRVRFKSGVLYDRTLDAAEAYNFQKFMNIVVANTTSLAGLRITYNSVTGNLAIASCNGTVAQKLTPSPLFSTALTVAYDTWYRFEITVTLNSDDTRSVEVIAKDNSGTLITTLTGLISATVSKGPICGFVLDSKTVLTEADFDTLNSYSLAPDKVYYDEISIQADVGDLSFQVNSGITTLYLSFFSDDTVSASFSLDPYSEETVATLPAGFVSPKYEADISVATVRGSAYACIRFEGETKLYNISINSSDEVVFTDITSAIAADLIEGYTINDIVTITSSFNYLILCTASRIFWSSTIVPTDFTESLITGAGSDIPNNLKGDITFCKEHIAGFFIYTTSNAVFAQYTGNSRYPWKFREIAGSGGFNYSTQVSGDTNTLFQLGITNSRNIQSVQPESAELIAAEVSDYLERGNTVDSFNYTTNVFTTTYVEELGFNLTGTPDFVNRLWFVLDRYIIVPVYRQTRNGEDTVYPYAVVFDNLLKRYGKIKLDFSTIISDEKEIYFISYETGAIVKLSFDIHEQDTVTSNRSVLILGKFQFIRNKFLDLEEIDIESVQESSYQSLTPTTIDFSLIVLRTLDGKNFLPAIIPTLKTSPAGQVRSYNLHHTARNFCIGLKGKFDASTVQLVYHLAGNY
jgi:hypothetical protein